MSDQSPWQGREPAVFRDGQRAPRSSSRRTPTATIRSQLSTDSSDTLVGRLQRGAAFLYGGVRSADSAGGRIRQATRQAGSLVGGVGREIGAYNRFLDDATRMNPYGGETPNKRMAPRGGFGRKTGEGFDGYYDEAEFEDPMTGEARFYPGDAGPILRGMAPEAVVRLQERLHKLGFLAGEYTQGVVREETKTAFADLLAESNRRGTRWNDTLDGLEQMYEELGIEFDEEGDRAPFIAPAYVAPDYATLAQTVKDQMRQTLGRDPDESEISQLTAELDGWYKGEYDVEAAALRSEYDAGASDEALGMHREAGTFRGVDPVARFKQAFEAKFADEIDFIEDRDETQRQGKVIQSGISTLSQMSGGMG